MDSAHSYFICLPDLPSPLLHQRLGLLSNPSEDAAMKAIKELKKTNPSRQKNALQELSLEEAEKVSGSGNHHHHHHGLVKVVVSGDHDHVRLD